MQIVSHVSKRVLVFAFLSEVTHAEIFVAAVIGEVFSFMVVQPWLRFQVLAMYIYHCGIFNIPSFLSGNGNSLLYLPKYLAKTFCAEFLYLTLSLSL